MPTLSEAAQLAMMFDQTRPPTAKEAVSLRRRHQQLEPDAPLAQSTRRAMARITALRGDGADRELRLRNSFVYLRDGIDSSEVSDRRAPDRLLRPAATRITSSQGAALRFELTLLAIAQAISKTGARGRLPELPVDGYGSESSWIEVIATAAEATGRGNHLSAVRDKKARSIRSALDTLAAADLVGLPGSPGEQGRYNGFYLLDEGGPQNAAGDPILYRVPRKVPKDEASLTLPAAFIENGWVHLLADSELTVLLMVASGYGAGSPHLEPNEVAVPADVRLRHFGIHRDPFSTARKTLEYFGLITVNEAGRHRDGRAVDAEPHLHRLILRPDAFEADAIATVRGVIEQQLSR